MTHWGQFNPWESRAIYISLEDLEYLLGEMEVVEILTKHPKVDAYILPNFVYGHSLGLRYGKAGDEYLSPPVAMARAENVLIKYIPTEFSIHELHARIRKLKLQVNDARNDAARLCYPTIQEREMIVEKLSPKEGQLSCEAIVTEVVERYRASSHYGPSGNRCAQTAQYRFRDQLCCTRHAQVYALNFLLEMQS